MSYFEDLQEENRILRELVEYIAASPPHYAYRSGGSHPDTNRAYDFHLKAKYALRNIEKLHQMAANGSD